MYLVTSKTVAVCSHGKGVVNISFSQDWVTVSDKPILIEPDPVKRPIDGCPNMAVGIDPCGYALEVAKGYSALVSISDKPVCLDSLCGPTDGTPGNFTFTVRDAGQNLVECSE